MKSHMNWLYLLLLQAWIYCSIFAQQSTENCYFARDECPNENISFWLYKNETQNDPLELDVLNIDPNDFMPKLPLKVIVHGYMGNRSYSPNTQIRPPLLQTQAVYVITVDYGKTVMKPCFTWAVQNTRVAAKCLGQLLDTLIEKQIYESEDIHLIGFSLGGQVVGLTANYVKNRLRRITSLDPGAPGFRNNPPSERIDPTDADFVDVIHTDPIYYSTPMTYGHVDFYPNFNQIRQPGCNPYHYGDDVNCSHERAPAYYGESITTDVGFWSFYCLNWQFYLSRLCRRNTKKPDELMGYFVSKNATGSYFLQTNAESPFARGPINRTLY